MKRLAAIFGLFMVLDTVGSRVWAQPAPFNPGTRNYFRNPMGAPMKLSANFGELRPDHWHLGLDIRTNAKENQPVYAAADGYIAHVGIRPQGYGRFIVINHPNGTSTLYAHLNDFMPELESYVSGQQHKQENWAVELDFDKSQFPVSKNAFIAYSGNTGGSQGPHLHFEIIETSSQKRLNPLLFDFNLDDKIAPSLLKLAMYDGSRSIYSQTPTLYPLKKTDDGYIIPKLPVIRTGMNKVFFAIQAIDRVEKGGSEDGIYTARLFFDKEPVISFVLDSIPFEGRVYINAHIDYRYDKRGGPSLQLLARLPGNHTPVYKQFSGNGFISLGDTIDHAVSIEVEDPHGNESVLNFSIRYDDSLAGPGSPLMAGPFLVTGKPQKLDEAEFKMSLDANSLYDGVPRKYLKRANYASDSYSSIHQVNDPSYPLHGEATISIKADKPVPAALQDRLLMQRTPGSTHFRKASVKDGWVTASMPDFGNYQVFADDQPPQINELGTADTINLSKSNRIVFTPTDNFSIIKNFRVDIDSQWARFTNDKGRNWIYDLDQLGYGIHHVKATATDLAGNTSVKTWVTRRDPYTPPAPRKKVVKKKKSSSKKKK